MRVADSDGELDRRIYQLGEFEKINNIAKRPLISYASNVASHSSSPRCQEDRLVVFRGFLGLPARPQTDVGYTRHDCWRRGFLGWLWADGAEVCNPAGETEKYQIQEQAVHPNSLPDKVLRVILRGFHRTLTVRFKGTLGTRAS